MKGWILYKESVKEEYEIEKFVERAKDEGIYLRVLAPEEFDIIVTGEERKSILYDAVELGLPDFFLPRTGAKTDYFSLAIVRHLERLGVYTVNSSRSIINVKDKLFTQQILASSNIPIPKTMLARLPPIDPDLVEKRLGFPVVVKTLSGTKGKGVFLAENKAQFKDLVELIGSTDIPVNILLQEYIESSRGRDLRVFVLGGKAIACMERKSREEYQFKSNFSAGGSVRKHELNEEAEWLATESARLLDLEIAGIDLLFDGDHFKVCEANSSPGFEGLEKCCEIDIAKEIYHFLRIRLGIFK
ncbi:MAG TPA: RimK family alpha-L-glutamate ligase [Thermoplasmata archaeon]|nr:RimK family alpha-L-glutamate ligase [Thermoplasmata archaeon]